MASLSKVGMLRCVICLLLYCLWSCASATEDPGPRVHYIANMGVMVEHGQTKIVFDPLFRNDYGIYDRVPTRIEDALLTGIEPWNNIDAVFISHHHEDHFDPAAILSLLNAQPSIELFGPEQAAAAVRELVVDPDDTVLKRVHGLSLENGAAMIDIESGPLLIEAARIPHAGYPDRHPNVENLVFRVTIDGKTTVMHLGDADPDDEHFSQDPAHWQERQSHLAMPPYWFFLSDEGRQILTDRIGAMHEIGLHVPTEVPDDPANRPEILQNVDLFTQPGETRSIPIAD